jgi:hypothetical protein
VTEKNISWFHCGRCGSLFQSPSGEVEDRSCSSCGRNPSLGLEAPSPNPEPPRNVTSLPTKESHSSTGEREKHSVRKRKPNYLIMKLVLGWTIVLVLIVFGAQKLWPEDKERQKRVAAQAPAKNQVSAEDTALLDESRNSFGQVFLSFLNANTPEERNQFVLSPITTAARMARFYSLNPIVNIDAASLSPTQNVVIHLPSRRGIETQWHSADGRLLDAVFFQENGEWRLDWDHFARYSDYPWSQFLAGNGEDRGEFRLLARERLADERKNEQNISLVLYAPRFGYSDQTGYQSPEFLIDRNTKNGRLLDAAFKLNRNGQQPFGVKIPNINPDGFIRVRVKVHRVAENLERRFELDEVVACHWYSEDAPGVEIEEKPAEK